MSPELNHLRLEQLQSTVQLRGLGEATAPLAGMAEAHPGSPRVERNASRLRSWASPGLRCTSPKTSEAEDRITLGQLRKLADGLKLGLVYALVPRRPLTEVVQERARAIAMEEVGGVAHTMGLEDQRPGAERLRKQVERRTEELLRGRWSDLWR